MIVIVCLHSYSKADNIAENKVAIYLFKEYNSKIKERYNRFMSYEKTYYEIKTSGIKYEIELSGTAYQGTKERITTFYVKVEVNAITGKSHIKKLSFDDEKIIK